MRGRGRRGSSRSGRSQRAHDRGKDRLGGVRALEAARDGAKPPERLGVARLLQSDLVDRLVLQNTTARHVAALRLPLAPCRDRLQDRKLARLLHAQLQALPGVLRMRPIGLDVGQDRHLLVEPGQPVLLGELRGERKIDVAKMRDVGDRVGDLLRGKRPVRPVGEADDLSIWSPVMRETSWS